MVTTTSRRCILKASLGLPIASIFASGGVAAPGWPSRNLRLIVGGAAGSVPDSLARIAADAFSKRLGQPFIVENRAGAGGIIAMQSLLQSPADGYTFGLATISQAVFNSYLFSKLPYDPLRDILPISILAGSSFTLAVNPSVGVTTFGDLIALSKKDPGKLLFGIPSNGSPPHIAALLLMKETGLAASLVPFKTGPEGLTAVIRGDVQLFIDGPALIAPQVDSRTVKAVVVTSRQQQDTLPGVPTVGEAGFPGAVCESWMGLVARRGTPDDVVSRLSLESRAIHDGEDYARKLKQIGFTPRHTTPDEFAALILGEHKRWSPILTSAGLKMD